LELFNVVTIDETKSIIDRNFSCTLSREKIKLEDSLGRITSADVGSREDVPGFKRSTVDGYAVCSRDVFGASESMESILNIKGEVLMGQAPPCSIDYPGECLYVPTGGMLPGGADSVVMIEYTQKLDDITVLVNKPTSPGENVIEKGEDISTGDVVIKKGTRLRPYEIGVLSSLGFGEVEVYRKPRVGIISTGDEIVSCSEVPGPGQVRDINTYLLYSLIVEDGGVPACYGLIRDDYNSLKAAVDKAVSECDIVLLSGGSSVGKKDQTLNVINSIENSQVLVHGISVKPGKPTIIAKAGDRIVFGLPGHPLACAVIYKAVVKYYMDRIRDFHQFVYPVRCTFAINYHKAKGREEYLPVTLNRDGDFVKAVPVFGKSGLITGFSRAWGYIRIERNLEGLREGQMVDVFKF
jgi:molybdenum cofactor synthesis domain